MDKFIHKKKLIILIIIIPVLLLIFLTPDFRYIYNEKKTNWLGIKNKQFKEYLTKNKKFVEKSCIGEAGNINYYNNIYNNIINITFNMEKNKFLSKKDRNILFNTIKKSNIKELYNKTKNMNLLVMNTNSLAEHNYLKALTNELQFYSFDNIEEYYKKAIYINKFNSKYRLQLAKFYQKNCKYDYAIDTLLQTASLSANSNINSDLYEIYSMLGDLYFEKRDYENALVYYVDALVNLDYRNKYKNKVSILTKIGDVMVIRGEFFEAINYYKYAMSLKKLKKVENITLSLKLASAYYSYGNYENSLKFAKNALKNAEKIENNFYTSKAKYYICLSYEYLGKPHKDVEKICVEAIQDAEQYRVETNNIVGYLNLADLLDYSNHVRNSKLAIQYLNQAMNMNCSDNIYDKVSILEKIAYIKTYSGDPSNRYDAYNLFKELNKYYEKYNVNIGCCNNLLKGFVKERMGTGRADMDYLEGIKNLKNRKTQLTTLYSYISDYYRNNKKYDLALFYAKKGVELSKQIYRFDHHYIKYAENRVNMVEDAIKTENRQSDTKK